MYDTLIVGQVCLDKNTDYDGAVLRQYGGAVLFSGYAAAAMGARAAALVKRDPETVDLQAAYADRPELDVLPLPSRASTFMENTYFTPDRERRDSRCTARIDPYRPAELPAAEAAVYHLAGLIHGDIGNDMVEACAARGAVALDVQCMLRHAAADGRLSFSDWAEKRALLPKIRFLKTDAAEAEILTGLTDRAAAARLLCDWGAAEVMITHNTEALVCDGQRVYTVPLRPRGLAGRTGRGDTCFAGYLAERRQAAIPDALRCAAALVSLKMETPGPFKGTRADVLAYLDAFYADVGGKSGAAAT